MTALVGAACRKQESGTTPGGEQSEIENVSADSLKAVFAEQVYDEELDMFQVDINQKAEGSLQQITVQEFNEIFD